MKIERHNTIMSDIANQLPRIFERRELVKILKCSDRTAQRYLKKMIEFKLIEISQDMGRRVIYRKIELDFLSYQKKFIDSYVPNQTSFLSKSELRELFQLNQLQTHVDLETYSIRVYERLIIDISWASSYLEGNTYSLLETEKLLLNNFIPAGKSELETQMILNHKEAIKYLILNQKNIEINELVVRSVHSLLSENILASPESMGALRKIPVAISGTNYIPLDIPQLIAEEFSVVINKARHIQNPFEQSLFLLIFIPYIQPFEDLNKRTSRISCNIPFVKSAMLPISFKNIDREVYLNALKDIYEKNNPTGMKSLFIKAYKDSSQEYSHLKAILVRPSLTLIQYRDMIKKLVYECVVKNKKITKSMIRVADLKQKNEVFEQIQEELFNLHEGSLVRFNLTPSQFIKWKAPKKLAKRSSSRSE